MMSIAGYLDSVQLPISSGWIVAFQLLGIGIVACHWIYTVGPLQSTNTHVLFRSDLNESKPATSVQE